MAHRISAIDARSLTPQASKLISIGHEACYLSHCKALNEFLLTTSQAALILEDDAEISRDVPGCLESTDWWPETTGLLQLSIFDEKVRLLGSSIGQTPCGRHIQPVIRSSGGAAGYLIDRETAQIILNAYTVPPMPIDICIFNMNRSSLARRLKSVHINPAMVRQRRLGSDINQYEGQATWKINQGYRRDRIRIYGLRLLGKAKRTHISYVDVHTSQRTR